MDIADISSIFNDNCSTILNIDSVAVVFLSLKSSGALDCKSTTLNREKRPIISKFIWNIPQIRSIADSLTVKVNDSLLSGRN